jgi:hypothetical protein
VSFQAERYGQCTHDAGIDAEYFSNQSIQRREVTSLDLADAIRPLK